MTVVEFKKNDAGKPRWSLLPYDVLLGVVQILGFGADKYGPDNWMNGAEWSRYYNSTQRHLIAFWMGEKCDPESGRSHLLHAICGLLFLAAYEIRGIGKDDRPKIGADQEHAPQQPLSPLPFPGPSQQVQLQNEIPQPSFPQWL